MRKNDIFLIVALIIFSLTPLLPLEESGKIYAHIYLANKLERVLPLDTDSSFTVTGGGGRNVINVKDGAVFVSEADCPDKICVRQGKAKKKGDIIACVPHELLIELKDHD